MQLLIQITRPIASKHFREGISGVSHYVKNSNEKEECGLVFVFFWALPKQSEVLAVHLGDPPSSGSDTQEVSWKAPLCTCCTVTCPRRDRSELLLQAQTHGEVSSPEGASWQPGQLQLLHHLSLVAPGCSDSDPLPQVGEVKLSHPSLRLWRRRDGADFIFKSTALSYSLISKCTQKPRRQLHQGMLSPKERNWSPLFPSTIRRSLHKDSLFLLLWLGPIWPERSPYSKQWTSSSADKTNH